LIPFQGQNGPFVWWTGVVEDINDPETLGRARVRIHGYHSADLAELPTVQLYWAHPIFPVTSACNRGKGQTVPGFLPGSHVFGFFLDGGEEVPTQPMILGTIPGINSQENDPLVGFNTPDAYQKASRESYNGKPDTNERATTSPYEMTEVHPRYLGMELEEVETATGETWNEPSSPANPTYPNNKVYESTTGHIIEIDDTSGAERINITHINGSYVEFTPDGIRIKSVGDEYDIVLGDNNVFVGGNVNITALGNVAIKSENFTFKGKKANFELEDDFTVNCKNFGIKTEEKINLGAEGQETNFCAKDKLSFACGGGAKIVLEGGNVNLNPPG